MTLVELLATTPAGAGVAFGAVSGCVAVAGLYLTKRVQDRAGRPAVAGVSRADVRREAAAQARQLDGVQGRRKDGKYDVKPLRDGSL